MAEKEKAPKPNQPLKSEALFEAADNRLTITSELLPVSEMAHHQLAALLDEKDPPEVSVDFSEDHGTLRVKVAFEHNKDIAKAGHENYKLHVEARNRGISLEALKAEKAMEIKAAKKATKPAAVAK